MSHYVVYSDLVDVLLAMYTSPSISNKYIIHQWIQAVQKLNKSTSIQSFKNKRDLIDKITSQYKRQYPTDSLRTAVNTLFDGYNIHSRNSSSGSARGSSRSRSRSRSESPKQMYDKSPTIIKNAYKCLSVRYQLYVAPTTNDKFMFTLKSLFDDIVLKYEIAIENDKKKIKDTLTKVHQSISCVKRSYLILPQWRKFLFNMEFDDNEYSELLSICGKNKSIAQNQKQQLKHNDEHEQKEKEYSIDKRGSPDLVILTNCTNKPLYISFNDEMWKKLEQKSIGKYQQRDEIINERIEQLIADKYASDVVTLPAFGNCLLYASIMNEFGSEPVFNIEDKAILDRKEVLQYMIQNQSSFANVDIDKYTGLKFNQNLQCLERPHLLGIHKWKKCNIFVLMYSEPHDNFHLDIFYDIKYKNNKPLVLLYSGRKIHFDWVDVPFHGFNKFPQVLESCFIQATSREEKFDKLRIFDENNNIQQIINDAIDPYILSCLNGYSEVLNMYSVDTINDMIQRFHITPQTFKNKSLEHVYNACVNMFGNCN
eukprot:176701_1